MNNKYHTISEETEYLHTLLVYVVFMCYKSLRFHPLKLTTERILALVTRDITREEVQSND